MVVPPENAESCTSKAAALGASWGVKIALTIRRVWRSAHTGVVARSAFGVGVCGRGGRCTGGGVASDQALGDGVGDLPEDAPTAPSRLRALGALGD